VKKRLRDWKADPEGYVRKHWRESIDRPKHEGHGPGSEQTRPLMVRLRFETIRRALNRAWRWVRE